MKPFNLGGLLRVRELQEQQAAAKLAEANRSLGAADARRSRTRAALTGVGADAADAAALSALVAARTSGHVLLGELASLHDRIAQDAASARDVYTAARVNSLSLEKLQTRHVATETALELRAEQSAIDEIAVQGWRAAQEEKA